ADIEAGRIFDITVLGQLDLERCLYFVLSNNLRDLDRDERIEWLQLLARCPSIDPDARVSRALQLPKLLPRAVLDAWTRSSASALSLFSFSTRRRLGRSSASATGMAGMVVPT